MARPVVKVTAMLRTAAEEEKIAALVKKAALHSERRLVKRERASNIPNV